MSSRTYTIAGVIGLDDVTCPRVQVVLEVQVERNVQDTSLSIVVLLQIGEHGLGELLVLIQHVLRLVDSVTSSESHVRIVHVELSLQILQVSRCRVDVIASVSERNDIHITEVVVSEVAVEEHTALIVPIRIGIAERTELSRQEVLQTVGPVNSLLSCRNLTLQVHPLLELVTTTPLRSLRELYPGLAKSSSLSGINLLEVLVARSAIGEVSRREVTLLIHVGAYIRIQEDLRLTNHHGEVDSLDTTEIVSGLQHDAAQTLLNEEVKN